MVRAGAGAGITGQCTFIRTRPSGVPDPVLCAARRRILSRTARCRSEMRRGKAGQRLAKLTRAPRVAVNGATTATSSIASDLLSRYRENGSGRPLSSTFVG
jgi:hypothetical protein